MKRLSDPMRQAAPGPDVVDAIARTGFPLEHLVTRAMQSRGWSVISNHYYPDEDGRARELDLIAYRGAQAGDCEVVTALLVSCKKDAENTWALMTRARPAVDPNHDWAPVHTWTNINALREVLKHGDWKEEYIAQANQCAHDIHHAARDVFAHQVVSPPPLAAQSAKSKGGKQQPQPRSAPQNDSPIFRSIEGLFKAMHAEVSGLPDRMKKPRIYQFNLAIVADCPLVEVDYDGPEPVAREVGSLTQHARYMVGRRHTSALVHFVRRDTFEEYLTRMSELAKCNERILPRVVSLLERALLAGQPWAKEYFAAAAGATVLSRVNYALFVLKHDEKAATLQLGADASGLLFEIDVYDEEALAELNGDENLVTRVKHVLQTQIGAAPNFKFVPDWPF